MAHWNFRLVDISAEAGEPMLELCEAHYNDKGVPVGYGKACTIAGTVEGMRQLIEWYALALNKPVLLPADFNGSYDDDDEEIEEEGDTQ